MRSLRSQRGAALVIVIGLSAALLLSVAFLFAFATSERYRAIQQSREPLRMDCAGSGLEIAKQYFAGNYLLWNTFLADPSSYDPVPANWQASGYTAGGVTCTAPCGHADPYSGTLRSNHPELFYDLDGDGNYDVYIYVRDNADEFPPLSAINWIHDNDQSVIIGALCISSTMAPRGQDGFILKSRLMVETLLAFNGGGSAKYHQSTDTETGTGNLNDF